LLLEPAFCREASSSPFLLDINGVGSSVCFPFFNQRLVYVSLGRIPAWFSCGIITSMAVNDVKANPVPTSAPSATEQIPLMKSIAESLNV